MPLHFQEKKIIYIIVKTDGDSTYGLPMIPKLIFSLDFFYTKLSFNSKGQKKKKKKKKLNVEIFGEN